MAFYLRPFVARVAAAFRAAACLRLLHGAMVAIERDNKSLIRYSPGRLPRPRLRPSHRRRWQQPEIC